MSCISYADVFLLAGVFPTNGSVTVTKTALMAMMKVTLFVMYQGMWDDGRYANSDEYKKTATMRFIFIVCDVPTLKGDHEKSCDCDMQNACYKDG